MFEPSDHVCGLCGTAGLIPSLPYGSVQRPLTTTVMLRCNKCGTFGDKQSLDSMLASDRDFSTFQAGAVQEVYANQMDMTKIETEVADRRILAESLAAMLPADRRLACMDFGCGSGLLSCALAKVFQKVYAIDLDVSLVSKVAEATRTNLEIKNLDLVPKRSLDLIVAWHVLEHLPNPNEFFTKAVGALKKGGLVVAQIPMLYPPYLEEDHLWFFTLESITWIKRKYKFSSVKYALDESNQFLTMICEK